MYINTFPSIFPKTVVCLSRVVFLTNIYKHEQPYKHQFLIVVHRKLVNASQVVNLYKTIGYAPRGL